MGRDAVGSPEIVVIGSANVDLVTRVERLPAPGETVLATGYAEHPGGKGANQAIAATRLGRAVSFVGVVGDERHGALLTQAPVAEGVDVAYLRRLPGVPTGRALVLRGRPRGELDRRRQRRQRRAVPRTSPRCDGPLRTAAVAWPSWRSGGRGPAAAGQAAGGLLNPAPARPLDADLLGRVDVLVVNEGESPG